MSGEPYAADEVYTAHLDRYHRHWPVVPWALFMALFVWAGFTASSASNEIWKYFVGPPVISALGWLMWRGTKRRCVIVSAGGIVEKGWFFENTVRFDDVKTHAMTLEDTSIHLGSIWDDGIGEFIVSIFVALFTLLVVRPARWLLRLFAYGPRSDVFHRGLLLLYGEDKKVLYKLEASAGWRDVENLFRRITYRLEQRATASSVESSRA